MPRPRRSRSNASESPIVNVGAMETIDKDTLALTVLELLKDNAVVAKLKATLFPVELNETIKNLTAKVVCLTNEVERKETQIIDLEKRVDSLEKAADDVEQYSRRPNLRFHGFPEADMPENTDQLVINMVNSELNVHPPMLIEHLERSHRLRRAVTDSPDSVRSSLASGARDFETLFTDQDSTSRRTTKTIEGQ